MEESGERSGKELQILIFTLQKWRYELLCALQFFIITGKDVVC